VNGILQRIGFAMRILISTFATLIFTVPVVADELRVGAAAVVITPPIGTPMAGYYSERAAEGVHDDLYAKALVLEKDGAKAALVSLDLISTVRQVVTEARREIERTTGVRGDAVMISATHSHTGPLMNNRGTREAVLGGTSDLALRYTAELPIKLAQAVKLAEERLAPARATIGHGHEGSIAFNRRYHMADGSVGWNPGKLNPRILKPAGPIDPDLPVVVFASPTKKPLAVYANYAVHLDNIGGLKFSADVPYTFSKLLADVLGPEIVTVYTTGCCGDVNHVDVNWAEPQKGFENAARMGTILAAEVLRTMPRLKPVADGSLRVKSEIVKLPLAPVTREEVTKARDSVKRRGDGRSTNRVPFLEQVQAFKVLDVDARHGQPHEVEVQVVAIGREVAWVSLPGEIFAELGLALKQDSPFPHTIIAELANGSVGYIPARRAFAQGNYEVVSTRCAEGSGELLVATAVRLLKELFAEGQK
jgi:Neutral/alkaline non-lysosomal ceramidase, N-terminal